MQFFKLCACVFAARFVTATPFEMESGLETSQCTTTPTVANFESLGKQISITSVGVYKGLDYSGWGVATSVAETIEGKMGLINGLEPESPTNAIITFVINHIFEGSPRILIPPGSLIKTFSATSLYFGCFADSPIPSPCTVQIIGSLKGSTVVQRNFTFVPPSALTSPMTQAFLGEAYADLDTLTFALLVAEPTSVAAGIGLDNFAFTTCE